jgi:tetratricopeptide (TPR) repeat protein
MYLDAAHHALRQGASVAAEKLYLKALQQAEFLGKHDTLLVQTIDIAASFFEKCGKLNHAEQLYRRALQLTYGNSGYDHPEVVAAINNLVPVLIQLKEYDEAESLLKHAMNILALYPGSMQDQLIETLCHRAALSCQLEKYAEAETRLTQAMRHAEVVMGSHHPTVACIMEQYADLLKRANRLIESERAHTKALQLIRNFKSTKADPPVGYGTPAYAAG